ncbi:MAG: 50S ribosomal protein L9 [Chloroflexia bacterium]|nr:50S ribosomal protein L9 [Chloroflexia bacterium]
MKIVMRQDVDKVGEAGTVQTVSSGYARNYLIPKGWAVVATDGELKVAAHNLAVKERKITRQEDLLRSLSDKIDGQRLVFTARAGEQGRLYGSITATEVATMLGQKIGEDIDRRRVVLDDPLRTLGEHTVTLHLVGRLRPQITVVIEPEHVEEKAPAASESDAVAAPAADAAESSGTEAVDGPTTTMAESDSDPASDDVAAAATESPAMESSEDQPEA